MMKKFVSLLVAVTLAFSMFGALGVVAADEEQPITVVYNGTQIEFDQPPVTMFDRTLVPMRAIFEAMGADVTWVEDTETILATKDDITIALQINNNMLFKNTGSDKQSIELDVPAQLVGDRTMVPVRAISEAFTATVGWDEATKTVTITL